MAKNLREHLLAYSGEYLEIKDGEGAQDISKNSDIFTVKTEKSEYEAKTVLIATGSTRRKLEVPGAIEFDNKGLTYCAS